MEKTSPFWRGKGAWALFFKSIMKVFVSLRSV